MGVRVSDANRIRAAIRTIVADRYDATFAEFAAGLDADNIHATRAWRHVADIAGVETPNTRTRATVLAWLNTINRPDPEGTP